MIAEGLPSAGFSGTFTLAAPDRPSLATPPLWTTSLANHDVHQDDIGASHWRSSRGALGMSRALDLPHSAACTCEPRPVVHRRGRSRALASPSGPSSYGHRDLKVASCTSRTTLMAPQASAEQSAGWMTAIPLSPPIRPFQIGTQGGGQNFDRRLPSTILDSGARFYKPGKRATSRFERAIMLLAALEAGTERAQSRLVD